MDESAIDTSTTDLQGASTSTENDSLAGRANRGKRLTILRQERRRLAREVIQRDAGLVLSDEETVKYFDDHRYGFGYRWNLSDWTPESGISSKDYFEFYQAWIGREASRRDNIKLLKLHIHLLKTGFLRAEYIDALALWEASGVKPKDLEDTSSAADNQPSSSGDDQSVDTDSSCAGPHEFNQGLEQILGESFDGGGDSGHRDTSSGPSMHIEQEVAEIVAPSEVQSENPLGPGEMVHIDEILYSSIL
ncbi:hypothetical protein TWF696_009666 [Orbilia brochopaga]|uniref:Uncharacterized protein n=1 Tax=Orbilia brochopaga TaxID=3140254 RepID=A0AAV9UBN9_9PEZI